MAQKHRKLFPINSTDCQIYPCDPYPYPDVPPDPDFFFPPPPPPLSSVTTNLSPYLIISLSLFAAVSVLLTAYVVLAKRCFRRPRSESNGNQDFLDHNYGPEIDHPIWYINTVGLQSSVIDSIAIFKYKKDNTLIKESTCSVCLSEFVEDETLRLLPKCKHAFHIGCIDTWLRSHTNCPLCRALILSNSSRAPLEETSTENTNLGNNANVRGDLRVDSENRGETEDLSHLKEICHSSKREKGRRSVSMDSSIAVSIGIGSCDFAKDQMLGNLVKDRNDKHIYNFGTNRTQYHGSLRIGSSSSAESLHTSPVSMKKSFSCSGRLFSSSRYNSKSSSSVLPL